MSDNETRDPFLDKVGKWKTESDNGMSSYYNRWARNMKLSKGIFSEENSTYSSVRKREKIFYRKTWAIVERLLASFYAVFMKDPDVFKIEGRDTKNDPHKAKVLHFMTKYRFDGLMRNKNLFLKIIGCFKDIADLGACFAKPTWEYNEEFGIDEPDFIPYPPEQMILDLTATTKDKMGHVGFINYLTKDEMSMRGYKNVEMAEATVMPNNPLRNIRHFNHNDPLQNPGENEYPSSGRYGGEDKRNITKKYEVWELFWKEKGVIKFAVTNTTRVILKETVDSPYGKKLPLIMGLCLIESHKLLGEGFHEPLEGPQESFNYNLNQRKDNLALSLNGQTFVSRFAGVDMRSLINSRPGNVTMMDDINGVVDRKIPDFTVNAYREAAADESMMQEASGVTAGKQGMETAEKATVAQINFAESNAKIELYNAMVGETFFKDFIATLAYNIQIFETDEDVFRIANDTFREKEKGDVVTEDIYDLDFEANCVINVGLGPVGRQFEIQQNLLAMDRATMANQSMIQLLATGVVPPEGIRLFDLSAFMEDLLPKLGKKNVDDFFLKIPAATALQGLQNAANAKGGQNAGLAGAAAPQAGGDQDGAFGSV